MGQRSDVSKDIQPPAQSMAKERGWGWGGSRQRAQHVQRTGGEARPALAVGQRP